MHANKETQTPHRNTSIDPNSRANIYQGLRVAVVLKKDQPTGSLTHGVVREILTSAAYHPHGIKVRLEDGQVGRVQAVYA